MRWLFALLAPVCLFTASFADEPDSGIALLEAEIARLSLKVRSASWAWGLCILRAVMRCI